MNADKQRDDKANQQNAKQNPTGPGPTAGNKREDPEEDLEIPLSQYRRSNPQDKEKK